MTSLQLGQSYSCWCGSPLKYIWLMLMDDTHPLSSLRANSQFLSCALFILYVSRETSGVIFHARTTKKEEPFLFGLRKKLLLRYVMYHMLFWNLITPTRCQHYVRRVYI